LNTPQTISQLFFNAVDRFGTKRAALRHKQAGQWTDITHQELARSVQHTALGLRELGINRGDRVAILSENRPEWAIADLACLTSGFVDVAIYATLTASQISYILNDSRATAVFLSDRKQLDKIEDIRNELTHLRHLIAFDDLGDDAPVTTLAQLKQRGATAEPKHPMYRDDALSLQPDTLATLIYTSGTTGDPKGVMLTQGNFASNVSSALKILTIGPDDSCLSLLPLSHAFERTCGFYATLQAGATINYAESIDQLRANMLEVRPTILISVPRLYEKIFSRIIERALSGGAIRKRMFFWAKRVAERWTDLRLSRKPIPSTLATKRAIADRLVFRKVRAETGGRLRFFVSGGAPLAPDIARFFHAAGLPILEGYGLTETSPVLTVNPYEAIRIGTVGRPIPGTEIRIAEDGEVLARGPGIMTGYYNKPDATAQALDPDGWFHTGDIGEIDPEGYLKITDRKKDIIVTAGGKKIAPQPIENRLESSPFVANAVMIGDKRKYAIVLVVPDIRACRQWAGERRLTATGSAAELIALPEVAAKVEREVMVLLRDLARFEMPKKVILLPEEFTVENGELTPTLKVKRHVIEAHYRELIDAAYEPD
jgi:long-chain acyl-CoA synthetase